MRVLVCGGRDYDDLQAVWTRLDDWEPERVIQGGASGADALARMWCAERNVPCDTYYARWDLHGKAAGPIRNQRMLDEGMPGIVLAFPGGRGTADMVRRAKAADLTVIEVANG